MKRLREFIWYHFLSKFKECQVPVKTKHGKLYISTQDQVIGRELYINQEFEWDKIKKVMSFLKKDQNIILDIGANIGTVCLPFVANGYFKRAYAFEPEEKNYSILKKNIKLNRLQGSVMPINVALSDFSGPGFLKKSASNFGDHRLQKEKATGLIEGASIKVSTLDLELKNNDIDIDRIDLIWMDVQGHEYNVLRGAKNILNREIPMVIEFWPFGLSQAKINPQDFTDLLFPYFSGFYDLALKELAFTEISAFMKLFDQYTGETFTDLLLLPHKR